MPRYLALLSFTEQGLRNVHESSQRAADFRASVERTGGKTISQYWAVGQVDGCAVFETPDEETAAALLLSLGKAGNVRTQTMRLYEESEFASILENA